jgi:hypothetical protein
METLKLAHIRDRVFQCLDEIDPNLSELITPDTDSDNLNTITESKIRESVEEIHKSASYWRMTDAPFLSDIERKKITFERNDRKRVCASISMSVDLMRIIKAKMGDWKNPVYESISESSKRYVRQKDEWSCGTFERPIAAIVSVNGDKKVELYSSKSDNDTLEELQYVNVPIINSTTSDGVETKTIDVCKRCEDAVIYHISAMVMINYQMADKATQLMELVKKYIS